MKRVSLLALCVLFPAVASAQVYKCDVGGKTVYQQRPCKHEGGALELEVHQPTEQEVRRAEARGLKDKIDALKIDVQRDANQRQRQATYARQDAERAKCDKLLADAEKADKEAGYWMHPGIKQREHDKAKALRDRHFSECFSRGRR